MNRSVACFKVSISEVALLSAAPAIRNVTTQKSSKVLLSDFIRARIRKLMGEVVKPRRVIPVERQF